MCEFQNNLDIEAISIAVEHNLERKKLAYQNIFREEGIKIGEVRGKEEGIKIGEARGEEKGEKKGLAKGVYNTQKEMTISTFKVKYPNFDFTLLEDLTLEQYKAIFVLLINDKSLEEIQEILN